MWVKIKKATQPSYWYADKIGDKFEVDICDYPDRWKVINTIRMISKEDCVKIKEPKKRNKMPSACDICLLYIICNTEYKSWACKGVWKNLINILKGV